MIGPAWAAKEKKAAEGLPFFVEVKPIVISIIRDGYVLRNIGVSVILETDTEENKEHIEANLKQLRHRYILDLRNIGRRLEADELLNLFHVKKKFMKTSEVILGKDILKDVLIKGDYNKNF